MHYVDPDGDLLDLHYSSHSFHRQLHQRDDDDDGGGVLGDMVGDGMVVPPLQIAADVASDST